MPTRSAPFPWQYLLEFLALLAFVSMLFAAAFFIRAALGSPPPGSDGANAEWFQSLRQNAAPHASCCSIADCRPTQSREVNGHYEAKHEGAWYPVPDDVILRPMSNPMGESVACISPNLSPQRVLCFIPGPKT